MFSWNMLRILPHKLNMERLVLDIPYKFIFENLATNTLFKKMQYKMQIQNWNKIIIQPILFGVMQILKKCTELLNYSLHSKKFAILCWTTSCFFSTIPFIRLGCQSATSFQWSKLDIIFWYLEKKRLELFVEFIGNYICTFFTFTLRPNLS